MASPHYICVPIAAKKSIPNITRSNMVGITKNGIHTRVPAISTRVRHSSFTARLDRSAIIVLLSCISSGLAFIRTYPSLAKLLDAPISTVASTHRPPISTVAVIRPLLILDGRFLEVGLLFSIFSFSSAIKVSGSDATSNRRFHLCIRSASKCRARVMVSGTSDSGGFDPP